MKSNKKKKTAMNWLLKARESWENTGNKRPPFAVVPKKGQRSVWDFPRPPVIEKVQQPVMVKYQGETIADSHEALAILETASPPTYYMPVRDIDLDAFVSLPGQTSMCEWKGVAVYWALKDSINRAVAWSYPKPFTEFEALKNHLAFYPQRLECYVNGERVEAQASEFYAGWITPDLTGPFKGKKGTEHW